MAAIVEDVPTGSATAPSTPVQRVSLGVKVAYSLGLYGIGMVHTSFSILLMFCYTDVFGIPAADAGMIIFFGSAIDIVCNLSVPWLTTRIRTRIGRYRPLLIIGGVFLAAAFASMFTKPALPASELFVYAFATHMFYRAAYAFVLTPHASLIGRITDDADERAAVGSYKAIGSNLGTLTAAYLGLGTVEWLSNGDPARGFMWFGLIFGTLAGVAIMASGVFTRESSEIGANSVDTGNPLHALRLMFANPQLVIVLVATLIFFCGYTVLNGSVLYFFKYVLDDATSAKWAILSIGIGGIFMPFVWNAIVAAVGKRGIWLIGSAMVVIPLLIVVTAPEMNFELLMALYVIIGAGKSGVIMNYFAVTADAVDYGDLKHGQRTEAYSFGMLAISNKVGTAIGGMLLGLALSWSGFVPNISQSTSTISDIARIACLLPAILVCLSCVVIFFFKISATYHRSVLEELRARKEA